MGYFSDNPVGRTIKYVAPTILLGAVGSGLWDWILKPAASNLSYLLLNITTLGLNKYKNLIYGEISFGLHEKYSIFIFAVVLIILPLFFLMIFAMMFIYMNHQKMKLNYVINKDRSCDTTDADKAFTAIAKAKKEILFAASFCAFGFVFFSINAVQETYVNNAIVYFNRMVTIARPYMGQDKVYMLQSRFAQVGSKNDYEILIEDLRNVCRGHNITYPQFKIW